MSPVMGFLPVEEDRYGYWRENGDGEFCSVGFESASSGRARERTRVYTCASVLFTETFESKDICSNVDT